MTTPKRLGVVTELLAKVRAAATKRNIQGPEAYRPPLEESIRALLSELAAESEHPKRRVELELYVQAAYALLLESERLGRERATAAFTSDEDECSCRCREHRKTACARCLIVERCQVHREDE